MHWVFLWVFCINGMGWTVAAAAQAVVLEPAPAWVFKHEALVAAVSAFDGPVTYLLVDRQDSFVGAAPQAYFRLVGRINNAAGLDELSQIVADFDPGFEKLIFHHIRIQRPEAAPVITLKPKDFELIRREKNIERQVFDGTLTASYLLHDLRVGDVVDYAFSVVGQNPLLGKKFSGRHDLIWKVPVLEAQIRQIWPTDSEVQWRVNRPDTAVQQRIEGAQLVMQWTARKLAPQFAEDRVPEWMNPVDSYAFSTWQNWDEVVRWALPFYESKPASDQAVSDMAQRIRERVQERKAQVEEAIRFVQDDIRYVGIEIGAGSFVPRPADEVLRKRFGDSKDKALLLTRLIQKLGFEAFPILVRREGGQQLAAMPPTPLAFNHVVVGVRDPEQKALYWVDGTLPHQGFKLESRDYPRFFQGLPLRPGTTDLLQQDAALTPVGRIEYQERYETHDFLQPLVLTIRSKFFGWQAEKMRANLAAQGSAVLSDRLANFIKGVYPAANRQQEPVFQDDRFTNELTITESYAVPDLWRPTATGAWRLDVGAGAYITQYLMQPEKLKRLHPVALEFPLQISHRQDIVIAEKWSVPSSELEINNSGFRYRMNQKFQDGVLSFVHDWESLGDHVDLANLPEYLKDADAVRRELGRFASWQAPAEPTFWGRFTVAFPQILGLFILFLVAIGWQLQNEDWVEGRMIWPRRSLLFMLLMLVLSSGAFALFWYADADRRLRKIGRSVAPRSLMWLSLGIFAAALATRGIQVIMDPASFREIPLPMLAVIPVLHTLWAFLMLRLLKQELPELKWGQWPSLVFGPLYFQSKMQGRPIPQRNEAALPSVGQLSEDPLAVNARLHSAEEGHEPRSEVGY